MKWKTVTHVVAAVAVVGLAASSAYAIKDSGCFLSASRAKKIKCQAIVKGQGGLGGKITCELDAETFYGDEGHNLNGLISFPVGNETVSNEFFVFCPPGRGTRFTNTVAKCKFNTGKDDSSEASFVLGEYNSFFGWVNSAHLGSFKKKSKAYRPIEEQMNLESGKIASNARVFDGFSKYNGTFKATFKGRTESGKKVKAQFKLTYKAADRSF
jgi:hypothetical protein